MLNLKLGLESPLEVRVTTVEDLVAATSKLTDLKRGKKRMKKRPDKMLGLFLTWALTILITWVTGGFVQ